MNFKKRRLPLPTKAINDFIEAGRKVETQRIENLIFDRRKELLKIPGTHYERRIYSEILQLIKEEKK